MPIIVRIYNPKLHPNIDNILIIIRIDCKYKKYSKTIRLTKEVVYFGLFKCFFHGDYRFDFSNVYEANY